MYLLIEVELEIIGGPLFFFFFGAPLFKKNDSFKVTFFYDNFFEKFCYIGEQRSGLVSSSECEVENVFKSYFIIFTREKKITHRVTIGSKVLTGKRRWELCPRLALNKNKGVSYIQNSSRQGI